MGHSVWTAVGAAALVVLVLTGVFIVRLRYLAGRVGSSSAPCDGPGAPAGPAASPPSAGTRWTGRD